MELFYDYLQRNEDWLIDRIVWYAKKYGYSKFTSTLREAWRASISGLTESIGILMASENPVLDISPLADYNKDPASEFGINEARRHRSRGISLPMFFALMKYYRNTYIDLIDDSAFITGDKKRYTNFIDEFFNRIELSFLSEWSSITDNEHIIELRDLNRSMTNEKNKYLTIFHSLASPVILLNGHNKLDCLNNAALDMLTGLFNNQLFSTVAQFVEKELFKDCREFGVFIQGTSEEAIFEKGFEINEEKKYYQIRLQRMLDVSEKFGGTVIIFNDITERYIIQETTLQLASIVESSDDAIIGTDLSGDIISWNKGAEIIYGCSYEEVKGKQLADVVRLGNFEDIRDNFNKVKGGLQAEPIETESISKIDELLYLSVKCSVIRNYSGEVIGFSLILRDVTKRRKAEDKERSLLEAVQYEKIKSEFFANLSHEFRTPINVMYSSLQVMQLGVENNFANMNIKRYIGVMEQNCYRLLRLIRNLIDITKMDVGHFSLSLVNYDIVNLTENITASIIEYGRFKGISIIFDTDTEEKVIACDPEIIERIMLNLLSNAVKFSPQNSTIEVKVGDLGSKVLISITDEGIGIEKDDQKYIFDRFRQVDKSFTRENEGSGIGLSLVKELVELHKGVVRLKSEPGKGTEFQIELPAVALDKECSAEEVACDRVTNIEDIRIEFSDIYS